MFQTVVVSKMCRIVKTTSYILVSMITAKYLQESFYLIIYLLWYKYKITSIIGHERTIKKTITILKL